MAKAQGNGDESRKVLSDWFTAYRELQKETRTGFYSDALGHFELHRASWPVIRLRAQHDLKSPALLKARAMLDDWDRVTGDYEVIPQLFATLRDARAEVDEVAGLVAVTAGTKRSSADRKTAGLSTIAKEFRRKLAEGREVQVEDLHAAAGLAYKGKDCKVNQNNKARRVRALKELRDRGHKLENPRKGWWRLADDGDG